LLADELGECLGGSEGAVRVRIEDVNDCFNLLDELED
jgi:hypothetical protein